ncbi:Imm1 family immunity protein [Streptomyces sp. NPDC020883]|uniref:Imm1 family immunity protein n=1 Tax=Streptomyces sp. NPDC020883 TaxID=3365099 RepID=UPI0037934BEA
MILNAVIHGTYHYAENWREMSDLITEVTENLKSEDPGALGISPGDLACFMFASERHTSDTFSWWPDNFLHVAVNASTGYGGLTWNLSAERAAKAQDEMSNHVWVTDNSTPPDFDPRVVSDPGYPLFYSPSSTLPVSQIRAALEEFYRAGTGNRPECVSWVRGELNGQRLDGE